VSQVEQGPQTSDWQQGAEDNIWRQQSKRPEKKKPKILNISNLHKILDWSNQELWFGQTITTYGLDYKWIQNVCQKTWRDNHLGNLKASRKTDRKIQGDVDWYHIRKDKPRSRDRHNLPPIPSQEQTPHCGCTALCETIHLQHWYVCRSKGQFWNLWQVTCQFKQGKDFA
jgi:hypothetical protein